jgi:surfactin synthase thioesterase subunit
MLGFHPGVLDSCAQACNYVAMGNVPEGTKYMVSEVDDIVINPQAHESDLYAEVSMPEYDADAAEISGSIRLVDKRGNTLLSIGRIRLKEFDERKLGELMVLMDETTLDKRGEDRDFLLRYANADGDRRHELVLGYLSALLATILEMDVAEISRDEPMRNYGLDSMTGLKFFRKTNQLLGVDVTFADIAQVKDLWELTCALVEALPGGSGVGVTQTKPYDEDLSIPHWIYNPEAKPDARVRLFCFPNGYRDADMFDGWRDKLGPEVEVCPIVLPGMDTLRIHEKPPQDIDKFMEVLNGVLSPDLLDLPCATFGHSWGSLYSFRLAYRLSRNPMARLVKMFVSGYAAPIDTNPSIKNVLDELEKHGMTRIPSYDEVRTDSETLDAVVKSYMNGWGYEEDGTRATLPQLLGACRIIDRYDYNREEKFSAPITAFEGVDDWVAADEIKLWDELTTGQFTIHTMAGDHQFINENQSEDRLLELIRGELLAELSITAGAA